MADTGAPEDGRGLSRRRALQAGAGAAGVAWITPTILASPVAASSLDCACSENLIVNASGESYTGDPSVDNALSGFATPTGWSLTNNFRVVTYGLMTGGVVSVPTKTQFVGPPTPPVPPAMGDVLFSGSFTNPPPGPPGAASSTAIQTIPLAGCATLIDAGGTGYSLSGWLGGYAGQADRMELVARFYDAANTLIGTSPILTVTVTDRGGVTRMLYRTTSGTVPVGTRSVQIQMTCIMAVIERYNGFADLLDFRLTCP